MFHINTYFFSILFILSTIAKGQNFSGKVVNEEDEKPIAFASVYATEFTLGTLTDSAGNFSFNNFPSSNVRLKISAIGFETKEITVNSSVENYVIIKLEHAHVHLDEIIISTPFGQLQNENVTNVESIRLTEINRIPSMSLSEAVANIPGVYQLSTGNRIGKPVIRGLSGTRVVTYLNGLRIENQQWGDDHGMGVTDVGIDGVEVIKGPASLLYGSDALGGVMYFIHSPYAKLNQFELSYHSKIESNTLGSSNELGLKWNKNGLKLNVFAGHVFHGDYMLPNNYRVFGSRFSSSTGKISIGYNKKNWVGNLHYNFLNSFLGIPGHSHEDSVYAALFYSDKPAWLKTLPHQFITNHYTLLENKFFFGDNRLEIFLGNTINHLREFEEKVTIPGIDMNLNNWLYNVRWKQHITEKIQLLGGVQGMYQINRNGEKAEETLIPEFELFDAGVYLVSQLEWKDLTFQAGARYDFRNINTSAGIDFPNFRADYQSYNYSAGFAYEIDSLTFRMNVSSGFRSPHTTELLANGVHHGNFRYLKGNATLENENALQLDFSMGAHYDHLEISFNPFFTEISNYIYLNPLDSFVDVYQVFEYTQVEKAQLFGGDFSFHFHPHFAHWLHVQSSFSYIYAQDQNENALPLIPQNRINTQIKIEFGGDRNFRITDVVIQHSYHFDQNRTGFFETSTPAYNLLHAGVNMRLEKKYPLTFQLGVKNILNENYFDHLSRLKQIGLEMPGINFYLGIKYNFETKLKSK